MSTINNYESKIKPLNQIISEDDPFANDPIYFEANDDGWNEGLKEYYILNEEDKKIIPMTEEDIDYLNPYDIRNHAKNIISDISDTPAAVVKKRRRIKKKYPEFLSHDETLAYLNDLTNVDKEDLYIPEDVDSPNRLIEAFLEIDQNSTINNNIINEESDSEWQPPTTKSETDETDTTSTDSVEELDLDN